MADYTLAVAAATYAVTPPAGALLYLPRWRADFVVTDRRSVIDVINDMLRVTCGGFIYWADGKWYARLDEQNVIGCRPVTTAAVGTTNRTQAFVAPGPRIKVVCKLNLAEGFSNPTLRLRSTLAGADLATSTVTGLTFADNQSVTFDLSTVRLTTGATYYIVLNATTGVTWHQCANGTYTGGASWDYVDSAWVEEPAADFWFQIHYADHELRDAFTATSPEIPILGRGGKSSLAFSRSREEAPNVVGVSFYDQSDWIVKPVRYEGAAVKAGTAQANLLSVQALAVPTGSCAYRLARQWYNLAQRTNRVGCLVPQHGAIIAPGDVVVLTSVIGPLTSAWYRVRSIERRLGCFDLELVEYNWSDYSTEETLALDSVSIPTTVSANQWVNYDDDFKSGTTATGDIGELGWSGNSTYCSYTNSADHPGQIVLGAAGGSCSIKLDAASQLFAANSVWSARWIYKSSMDDGANKIVGVVRPTGGDVFDIIKDGSDNILVNGVDSELDAADATWLTVTASCDGAGTISWSLTAGTTVKTGSLAISGTTVNCYIFCNGLSNTDQTTVDRASVALGATR